MSIGSKIKRIREKKGFTQETMAERIGMSQPNYNRIESDKNKTLSWDVVQKIAQTLEIDVSELQAEDCKVNITNHITAESTNSFGHGSFVIQQADEKVILLLEKRIEDKDKVIALLEQQVSLLTQRVQQLETKVVSS